MSLVAQVPSDTGSCCSSHRTMARDRRQLPTVSFPRWPATPGVLVSANEFSDPKHLSSDKAGSTAAVFKASSCSAVSAVQAAASQNGEATAETIKVLSRGGSVKTCKSCKSCVSLDSVTTYTDATIMSEETQAASGCSATMIREEPSTLANVTDFAMHAVNDYITCMYSRLES